MFRSFSTLSLPPLNEHNAAHWVRAAAEAARLYQPPKLEGRGIVIPAGGRYVPSAYVTIKTLRHLGCQLPVQVWHLGPRAGSGHYYDHINAGVLFLRNHKNRAVAFLDQWMGTPDDRHPWGDQHALNKLYLETPSLVHVLDHAWNSLPHIAAYRSSTPQIVAYHGQSRLPTAEFFKLREEYQKHHGVTLSNE